MKRPFCTINGTKYQLYLVDGVVRFENIYKNKKFDLNLHWIQYQKGILHINALFMYYAKSGSSYNLVYEKFSKYNDLLNLQDIKKFRLYL